jgi:hypothetical protein
MDRWSEAVAVASLILGGVVALDGAPELEVVVVAAIVVAGVVEWWMLRKLGKEARDVGNRLLFLVGVTLFSLGFF